MHRVRASPRPRLSGVPSIGAARSAANAATSAATVRARARPLFTSPVLVAGLRPLVPERQGPAFARNPSQAVACGQLPKEGAAADW